MEMVASQKRTSQNQNSMILKKKLKTNWKTNFGNFRFY